MSIQKISDVHSLQHPAFTWTATPFPFGRICFVVLVMRKGGESS